MSYNVSKITIKRDMKKLIEKGFLVRVGSDKSGYWSVIKTN